MKLKYDIIKSLAFGVDYTEIQEDRVVFSRFSKQERNVLNYGKDNSFATAGVRLEFETDSRHLKIKVCVKGSNPHGRNFYSFDVYSNDSLIGQIKNFNKEPQYPYKKYSLADRQKTFTLSGGLKRIRIYFPWSVQGMIKEIEIDDGSSIMPVTHKRKIVMYGDSITQGYDSEKPSRSYASRLTDWLDADGIKKGIGGSVFLPELAGIKASFIPDFITVSYGTNDWNGAVFDSFKKRCTAFYENLTHNYQDTLILAIAPIWRADSGERRVFGDFSKVADTLKDIAAQYKNISFIDGIDFIPKNTEYYHDSYLHPNDRGFDKYADALCLNIDTI